jgi:hypothetical protein
MSVRDLRELVGEVVHSLGTVLWRKPAEVVQLVPAGGYCRGCGVGIDWPTTAGLCHRCVMLRTRR